MPPPPPSAPPGGPSNALGAASGALGKVNVVFGALREAAGAATAPVDGLTKVLGALNAPVLAATRSLGAFRDAATAMGGALSEFVKMANPAYVKQFQYAADDLTASIGHALVPALEFATKFTRMFADVAFALAGPVSKFLDAFFAPLGRLLPKLADATAPLVRVFGSVLDVIGPLFDGMGELFETFIEMTEQHAGLFEQAVQPFLTALGLVALAVRDLNHVWVELARAMNGVFKEVLGFLGLALPEEKRGGVADKSVGAAFRAAQIGDVQGLHTQALLAAFKIGAGPDRDEKRHGEAMTRAEAIYEELKTLTDRVGTAFVRLPGEVWAFVKKLPDDIWQKFKTLFPILADLLDGPIGTGAREAAGGLRDKAAALGAVVEREAKDRAERLRRGDLGALRPGG